jgi:hypothetical protein
MQKHKRSAQMPESGRIVKWADIEEDDQRVFDAYWETKYFWDKKHPGRDYYSYRSRLSSYPRPFFVRKEKSK